MNLSSSLSPADISIRSLQTFDLIAVKSYSISRMILPMKSLSNLIAAALVPWLLTIIWRTEDAHVHLGNSGPVMIKILGKRFFD